ncbi:hypothetical protein AB3S75_019527 [Citrus x aurantiifolia]
MTILVTLRPNPSPTSALLRPQPKKLALPTQHSGRPLHSMLTPARGWLFGKPVPTALTARLACQR